MTTPNRIVEAAKRRIQAAAASIEVSKKCIEEGRPLAAERDVTRAIQRVSAFAKVDAATAARIVEQRTPASLGLTGESLRRAEALQGKTVDYLGVAWLEAGRIASNCVARIILRNGQPLGTGFLISNRLLMTNNHVLADAQAARGVFVEFGFEIRLGATAPAPIRFELAPEDFFLTDDQDDLDYSIVALGAPVSTNASTTEFGCASLSASSAKHSVGEPVNIIEHPDGDFKQVVVRENRIVHRGDNVLHYVADTEPGASGSPVFNDAWQVVALHHWGSPHRETSDSGGPLDTDVNEGIRVSAIVAQLQMRMPMLSAARRALLADALSAPVESDFGTRRIQMSHFSGSHSIVSQPTETPAMTQAYDERATNGFEAAGAPASRINRQYSNRRGYNERFLPGLTVPMPQLNSEQRANAARVAGHGDDGNPFELKYQHFSVVLNATRRMAFFSICNIDGAKRVKVDRDSGRGASAEATETWATDPRVTDDVQLSDAFYARLRRDLRTPADFFARGHLTRREDPNWGRIDLAERANNDTYHHTNACPQLQNAFNGSRAVWQGIENFILNEADDANLRVTVITGPVFDDANDPVFEDEEFGAIQIPRRFWKIVARVEDGTPKVFAVLADQGEAMDRLFAAVRPASEAAFDWPSNLNREFRSTVREIAELTGLDFGDLETFDVFAGADGESLASERRPLRGPEDLFPDGIPTANRFGKHRSISAFLARWESHLRKDYDGESEAAKEPTSGAERSRHRPSPPVERGRKIVEIEASVGRVFADDLSGAKHQQFTIVPTKWLRGDSRAKSEVEAAIRDDSEVRIAIRFGDSRGLEDRIPGIRRGAFLHLKGEWISARDAFDVGGEDIPVLHFTHDPIGFVCTEIKCFS